MHRILLVDDDSELRDEFKDCFGEYGVTEAENSGQAQYGLARTLQCLAQDEPLSAAAVCQKLHADVKNFTAGAPPSDDLTLLAVGYRKPSSQTHSVD